MEKAPCSVRAKDQDRTATEGILKRGITKLTGRPSIFLTLHVPTMTSTALPLLRSLLREARHINDYNFRSYAVRRVKAGFDKNRNLVG